MRGAPRASTGLDPGEQESKAQDELKWQLGRRKMHTVASRTGTGNIVEGMNLERGRREHGRDDELARLHRREGRVTLDPELALEKAEHGFWVFFSLRNYIQCDRL